MLIKRIAIIIFVLLGFQIVQSVSWATTVELGEQTVMPGTGYNYGNFTVDLSGVAAGSDTSKYVKVANDILASSDAATDMPEFQVTLERKDPSGTWSSLSTVPLKEVPDTNDLLSGYITVFLSKEPDVGFAKIYTIRIRLQNGGWAAGQPAGTEERIKIGIQHEAADSRTYFAALGDTTAEAEVPRIKIISTPIDFGEVLCCFVLPGNLPEPEDLTIANIGTGVLNITNYGNPVDSSAGFSHTGGSLPSPFPLNSLTTQNLPISFTPNPTMIPGPTNTTMTISSNSSSDNELQVDLSATPVKLEVVMLYDISGSMAYKPDMSETTNPLEMRIGQAKLAGLQISTLLRELDGDAVRAGLVTFPRYESPICSDNGPTAFTKIPGPGSTTNVGLAAFNSVGGDFDDAWGTGADSLQIPINVFGNPDASTTLAEGLKVTHGLGVSNFGPGKWTEGEYVRRAILLLSDGNQYDPDCDSTPYATPADWATYFESTTISNNRAIKVFSLPYGTAVHVDHVSLQRIGDATKGGFYTGDPLDFSALYNQFRAALIDWRDDWTEVIDPKHDITKGDTNTHDVCIDDSVKRIAFIVDWEKLSPNAINFVLEGPDGVVSPSSADVSYNSGQNNAFYVVKGQTAKGHEGSDKWTLKLSGGAGLANDETLQYNYSVISKSKINMTSDSGSQPFYTLKDRLLEVAIKGLNKKLAESANVTLKYDIPKESYGTWLSSMDDFEPRWLVRPHPNIDPHVRLGDKQSESSFIPSALAQDTQKSPFAPVTIMGEPATMVQRKAYALKHFAKQPFQNLRSTGEVQLFDNGTYGDKVAGDGIYSTYLPALEYDGLARFGAFLNVDSDKDCLNRELRIDKLIRVALEPDIMAKNIVFKVADSTPFFPPELMKIIKEPVPEGFKRKNVVFAPQDKKGNLWGPGKANKIKFAVKNAEALGPVVDNLDGSYIRVIQYKKGDVPSVTVSARGVTTSDIPMPEKPFEIPLFIWILLAILILLVIIILIRRRL